MEINNSRQKEMFGGNLIEKYILSGSEMNWKFTEVERYRECFRKSEWQKAFLLC